MSSHENDGTYLVSYHRFREGSQKRWYFFRPATVKRSGHTATHTSNRCGKVHLPGTVPCRDNASGCCVHIHRSAGFRHYGLRFLKPCTSQLRPADNGAIGFKDSQSCNIARVEIGKDDDKSPFGTIAVFLYTALQLSFPITLPPHAIRIVLSTLPFLSCPFS